jgi:hypothetical protein
VRQFSLATINSPLVSGSSTTPLVETSSPQDTGVSQVPQPPPGYSIKPAKSRNSGFTAATKKQKKIKQQQMKVKAKQLKGELLVRQDFLSVPETGVTTAFLSKDAAPQFISLSSQQSPSLSSPSSSFHSKIFFTASLPSIHDICSIPLPATVFPSTGPSTSPWDSLFPSLPAPTLNICFQPHQSIRHLPPRKLPKRHTFTSTYEWLNFSARKRLATKRAMYKRQNSHLDEVFGQG